MAKRWSLKEDTFLHAYFPAIGDLVGTHDLGRPAGAATRRVALLKQTGAWACLERRQAAEHEYFRCLGAHSIEDEEGAAA